MTVTFPEPTIDSWKHAVDRALKGADFDETLRSNTADGLPIEPLYDRLPGGFALNRPHGSNPWTLVQKMDHPDPESANQQAREDLNNGATGLAMVFADAHSAHGYGLEATAETFDVALKDIDLAAIHLRLEPGPRGKKTQELFSDYCKRAGYRTEELNVRFGLDAIGAVAACGTMRWPFETIQEHMRKEWQNRRDDGFLGPYFEADGRIFHDAGATQAQELAIVLANGVAFLRTLSESGDVRAAADAIGFTLSSDSNQFVSLAKFRAMRLLWNRVQESVDLQSHPARLHAETSWRMLTHSDPNTNMLRIASAVFAAGVGGADTMTVVPFSTAQGLPDTFARRMARNVQSIFLEESNLFRVVDPAAGSGAFENLTLNLAEDGWKKFQRIEETGGIQHALTNGLIHGWLTSANNERSERLKSGEKVLLGVNLHADHSVQETHVHSVDRRPTLVITKGALTIESLVPVSDEEILGEER